MISLILFQLVSAGSLLGRNSAWETMVSRWQHIHNRVLLHGIRARVIHLGSQSDYRGDQSQRHYYVGCPVRLDSRDLWDQR
jgi:hypothetical protein